MAAAEVQRLIGSHVWRVPDGVRVRVALHSGSVHERDGDLFGPPVNRLARLLSRCSPGAVIVSEATASLLTDGMPDGLDLNEIGRVELRDVGRSESVYCLVGEHLASIELHEDLDAAGTRVGSLPPIDDDLVGRSAEIAAVLDAIAVHPVVSIVGVGGMGKTRLALETAAAAGLPDGAWWCDLTAATSPGRGTRDGVGRGRGASVRGTISGREPRRPPRDSLHARRVRQLRARRRRGPRAGHRDPRRVRQGSCARDEPRGARAREANTSSRCRRCRPRTPSGCSAPARARRAPTSSSTMPPSPRSTRSARASTGSRSRSSSPRPVVVRWRRPRSRLGSTIGSGCSAAGAVARNGTGRCSRPSSGRTRCSTTRNGRCSTGWRCSPGGALIDTIARVCDTDEYDALDVLDRLIARSMVVATDTPLGTRYRQLETLRQYAEDRLVEAGEIDRVRDRHLAWAGNRRLSYKEASWTANEEESFRRYVAEIDNLPRRGALRRRDRSRSRGMPGDRRHRVLGTVAAVVRSARLARCLAHPAGCMERRRRRSSCRARGHRDLRRPRPADDRLARDRSRVLREQHSGCCKPRSSPRSGSPANTTLPKTPRRVPSARRTGYRHRCSSIRATSTRPAYMPTASVTRSTPTPRSATPKRWSTEPAPATRGSRSSSRS